ncbi:HD domain-containing protein [Frateuria terrea]|uniref:HD domain-containing protein n=1 Tax=Frateuria terrea TaxID=529704 RepID=A0A1H6QG91_9GAMM|nr:HD domain-containing protein [Frateuria terrea]SEI42719.1 HD domain-containing protein [Frateuria terrea]SFP08025.1 HD domain-containing protein [Frateuria terrea]
MLTERFTAAVDYARVAHAHQCRKGTAIPYIEHLLGVASLVLGHGGDEDQAIAGLLHDVLEDCGEAHAAVIGDRFGARVLAIVRGCTDGSAEGKAAVADADARRRDWLRRKQAYLAHLAHASDDMLLVSGCDKLHNARAIVADLGRPGVGRGVFDRFTGGRDGTLTYYRLLADLFIQRGAAMAGALEREVERMAVLAGEPSRAA